MRAIYARIKAELALIRARADQKLNVLAALVVGYLTANSAQFNAAVTSLVPAHYQSLAGAGAGLISYAIVRAAAARAASKVAGNG